MGHDEKKKEEARKKGRERKRGLSTLEKRSFTVVDATVIRNGTFSVATLTTTIASSPLRLLVALATDR